jgi:hypothetical protein
VTIGTLFAQFDAVNNTFGLGTPAGTDSTLPLTIAGGLTFGLTPTACTPAVIGSMQQNNGTWAFCDGATWWDVLAPTPPSSIPNGVMEVLQADLMCVAVFGDCADGDEIIEIRGQVFFSPCTVRNPVGIPTSRIFYRSPCNAQNNSFDCLEFSNIAEVAGPVQRQTWIDCPIVFPIDPTYSVCVVGAPFAASGMKGGILANPNGNTGLPVDPEGGFVYQNSDENFQPSATMAAGDLSIDVQVNGVISGQLNSGLSVMCYAVNQVPIPPRFTARANGWRSAPGALEFTANALTILPRNLQIGGGDTGLSQQMFNGLFIAFYYFRDELPAPALEAVVNGLLGKFRGYR